MSRPASVSLVIVNWNAGEHLRACLQSLAEHPPSCDWDVHVIDNASTDGSVAMVRSEFPAVKLIANQPNRGLAGGNNQGINASQGEAVLICNPDVVFGEGSIDALLDAFERHHKAAFAIPRIVNPDGSLQPGVGDLPTVGDALRGRRWAHRQASDGNTRAFWWDGWSHDEERQIGHGAECAYLVRRSALPEIGLQDERFELDWEGVDWAARVAKVGWEVWFTPDSEVVHFGGASISQATIRWVLITHRGMARYMRKHLGLVGLLAQPLVAARAGAKVLVSRVVPVYERARRGSVDPAL